jgi:AraC family ethanolamine operon transcriptional activator
MLFRSLNASPALALAEYPDIDAFRSSERYARAESMPLRGSHSPILRARLSFPLCTLSLVRTFPRIIKGYLIPEHDLLIVVPMDRIASARINGRDIEQSLLLVSGATNCTVYEPEGRLVAVILIRKAALRSGWQSLGNDHLLIRLPTGKLDALQLLVHHLLERAAHEPEAIQNPAAQRIAEELLLVGLQQALHDGKIDVGDGHETLGRYHRIVEKMDLLIQSNPAAALGSTELAALVSSSRRTLYSAVQGICGLSPHRYVRIRRLWMVRDQLRFGAPGLTVRLSARAHGFHHMGEFSEIYKATFGEMPSKTLDDARTTQLIQVERQRMRD